jgi:hypothetical protein
VGSLGPQDNYVQVGVVSNGAFNNDTLVTFQAPSGSTDLFGHAIDLSRASDNDDKNEDSPVLLAVCDYVYPNIASQDGRCFIYNALTKAIIFEYAAQPGSNQQLGILNIFVIPLIFDDSYTQIKYFFCQAIALLWLVLTF